MLARLIAGVMGLSCAGLLIAVRQSFLKSRLTPRYRCTLMTTIYEGPCTDDRKPLESQSRPETKYELGYLQ